LHLVGSFIWIDFIAFVRVLNKLIFWIFWFYIREMAEDGNPSNSDCIGDCLWCLHTKADDCANIFLVMYQNEDKTNSDEVEKQDHIIKGNRSDHILILVWIHSPTAVNSNQLSVLLIACVFYLCSYDSWNSGHVFPVRYNYICTKCLVDNCEKQLYFRFCFIWLYAISLCPLQVLTNLDLL
jgi:hypothetical protein